MSGGQPKNTTTTTKTEPWSGIQPSLLAAIPRVDQAFAQPTQYYPGSTVVPFDRATTTGLDLTEQRALQGSPVMRSMSDQLQQTLMGQHLGGAPGSSTMSALASSDPAAWERMRAQSEALGASPDATFSSTMQSTVANPGSASQRLMNPNADFVSTMQGITANPGSASSRLYAMGGGGPNPHLRALFNQGAGQIQDNVDAMFSKAGRYGSTAHQGTFQKEAGDLWAQMAGQAYDADANRGLQSLIAGGQFEGAEAERRMGAAGALENASLARGVASGQFEGQELDRRMGAASALEQARQGTAAQRLQALGLGGDLATSGAATRLAAAGGLNDAYAAERENMMRSMFFAPQAAEADYRDLDRLLGVGGEREAQAGRFLQDDINRFQHSQNAPRQNIVDYINTLMGANVGGSGSQTSPLYRQGGGLTGALGGAASGAAAGSMFGPWGTGIGAVLGGFGGLFG